MFATILITKEPLGGLNDCIPSGSRSIALDLTGVISDKGRVIDRFEGVAHALFRTYSSDPEGWLDKKD